MTPEQALQMLYDLSTKVNMPKASHDKCEAGRDVIQKAITPVEAQAKETEDAT